MKDKSKRIDQSGSSFDEFLREEGMLEEAETVAIKRVIAWQLRRGSAWDASVKEDDQNAGTAS
jgi:hypothetical protein